MTTILIFIGQLAATLLICLLLTAYIRPFLKRVLVDLCGTEERAQFWTVFSNIMLVALPVIFGLGFMPDTSLPKNVVFQVAGQLRWNLIGFILSLLAIGGAVSFFALVAPRPQTESREK